MSEESKTWVSADIHLYHKNILKHCPQTRPFETINEMHDKLIINWNAKIAPQDTVYILGDITFGNVPDTVNILNQLNGVRHLIIGNHDTHMLKKYEFASCFNSYRDYRELKHNGKFIVMMHYPLMFWNKMRHNSYMIHGHLHSINPDTLNCRRFDVGLDGSPDFSPYLLDDVLDEIENRLDKTNIITDHHDN